MYFPLVMDKNVVILDHSFIGIENELNIENFKGHEFNFWKNILNFKSFKEFEEFISKKYITNTLNRNKKFEKNISKNLVFYNKDHTFMNVKSENRSLLKYYTDYSDNNSSKRIINYIENE
jgi:NAD-dependent SIR2 family protein deacetylase